jgi:hypothetical protein
LLWTGEMTRLRWWSCVARAFKSWRVASWKDARVFAEELGGGRRERGSETHIVFVVVVAAAFEVGRIALRRLAATVDLLRVVAVEVEVVEDGKLKSSSQSRQPKRGWRRRGGGSHLTLCSVLRIGRIGSAVRSGGGGRYDGGDAFVTRTEGCLCHHPRQREHE